MHEPLFRFPYSFHSHSILIPYNFLPILCPHVQAIAIATSILKNSLHHGRQALSQSIKNCQGVIFEGIHHTSDDLLHSRPKFDYV